MPTRSKRSYAWKGTCLICKAISDFCYTICVILLALGVCTLAYVTTLDEFPVPQFLLRQLEAKAQAQGAALEIDGIHLYPDGKILLEKPVLRSLAFNAPILEAQSASIDLDLPTLIFGHLKINTVNLSKGRFITPAVLSPSGTPSTLIDNVDFHLTLQRRNIEIDYLRGRLGASRLTAVGELPNTLFQAKPDQPKKAFDLRALLVDAVPKIWDARAQLKRAKDLSLHLVAHTNEEGQAHFDARLFTEHISQDAWSLGPFSADIHLDAQRALQIQTRFSQIENENLEVKLAALTADASWSQLPTPQTPLPDHFQVQLPIVHYKCDLAHELTLKGKSGVNQVLDLDATLRLADQAWDLQAKVDLVNKQARAALDGQLSNPLITLATEISQHVLPPEVPQQDLSKFADLPNQPDVQITARTGPDFKLELATVSLDAGPLVAMGTPFDRATASATFDGAQFSVPNVRIQKDGQHGSINIGYNLETRFRRFLVEGQLHPNHIDTWFEPWWAEFWRNFQLESDGFYILMDSQGTFGIPDSLRITGHAFATDFGIRGEPMQSFRGDMYILLHYFDIYNAEITRSEGYARGHVQIDMDRDPRDEKEKLAGLWIDAESTLDPELGKTVLFEVEKEVTEILEPYTYEKFPYIYAQSASIRHQDDYQYEIDLDIRTDAPLTYNDFPLQNLETKVYLDNKVALIPHVKATFGNGELLAKAEIEGDDLIFEATLKEADFGEALKSAVEYFEAQEDAPEEGYDSASMIEYGGKIDMNFAGAGLVGDFQSYVGEGSYHITEADLKKIQLFGPLGQVFEKTLLDFSTIEFTEASGPIQAKERYILMDELRIEGPRAVLDGSGFYDLEVEEMDLKFKLFPFRKSNMPHTALVGFVLTPISSVFELSMTGELGDPQVGLFGRNRKVPELDTGEGDPESSETPPSGPTSPKATRQF